MLEGKTHSTFLEMGAADAWLANYLELQCYSLVKQGNVCFIF